MANKKKSIATSSSELSPRPIQLTPFRCIAVFALVSYCLYALWSATSVSLHQEPPSDSRFHWASITPSKQLEYQDCFSGLQCARLLVPFDWNSTADDEGDKFALAIVRRPARVPVTDPRYGGPILLNPGGPGGSGVEFMMRAGPMLQIIADSDEDPRTESVLESQAKYFDLLSWDPRGVNNTTPATSCFEDKIGFHSHNLIKRALSYSSDEETMFQNLWAHVYAASSSCSDANQYIGQYLSTAYVVRDMIEIIERHAEWRRKASHILKSLASGNLFESPESGKEKIQYWGFSYGTYIGTTFASLYPERIHRIVLDGNIDPTLYVAWDVAPDLQDIDAITTYLATTCFAAGTRCPFFQPSASAIEASIFEVLESLKRRPISSATDKGPTMITYDDVVDFVFKNYYKPMIGFPAITKMLSEVSEGNVSSLLGGMDIPSCTSSCQGCSETPLDRPSSANVQIYCVDGDDLSRLKNPQDDFRARRAALHQFSPIFGPKLATWVQDCYGFNTRAKVRFTGPFGSNISHPILFTSSEYDPVTPLQYAYSASRMFPGSSVVHSTGYGHCSISMPSTCIAKNVRRYFQTGELPKNGTVCGVDREPFQEKDSETMQKGPETIESIVDELALAWTPPMRG